MESAQKEATLSLRIPVGLRIELERLAREQDRPLSNLVRIALVEYVEQLTKKR